MSQYSSKISELKDNVSSNILNELNQDDNYSIMSEDQAQSEDNEVTNIKPATKKLKKYKLSFINTFINKNLQDALVIFIIVLISNNKYTKNMLSMSSYIATLFETNINYSLFVALLVMVLYLIYKLITNIYTDKK